MSRGGTLDPATVLAAAKAMPSIEGFPTVDELAAWFETLEAQDPDRVASSRIGSSRLGEPLRCVTIGDGSVDVVVVAGVHPNEPIGFRTIQQLATTLLEGGAVASLDVRWHLVPCIDPDGTRLNEGWFDGAGDRRVYARNFYRPAPNEQVEWTFPTDYKNAYFDEVMPETLALMRLLDATRPALYVALHNGEMGGVYYYLNRDEPGLADALRALPGAFGLPLDEGEPESPYLRSYAPAVYDMGTIADAYDWLETLGVDPTGQIGGSSSGEYTSKHGTLSLVAELPYWVHPAAADTGRSDESYRDVVLRMSTQLGETAQSLGELLNRAEPLLRLDTSFVRATRAFVPALQSIADSERIRAGAAESARPATVAEVFSCADLITCFRYRYGGMLVRALSAEVGAGTAGPALRAVHADAVALYEAWLAEPGVADDATPAPLMALVGVQYGSILAAANAVAPSAVAPAAVPPAAGLAHGGHGGRGQA